MTYLIDTHAHIDMECFDKSIDDVLLRAFQADVRKIIIPGVSINQMDKIVALIEKNEHIYGAIACHPQEVDEWNDKSVDIMDKYLSHPKIIAIGETGLDYYWKDDNKSLQKEIFIAHIDLAQKHNVPLIIHSRDAHSDTLELLKQCKQKNVTGVMHCFSGSPELALDCIKEGFLISLGGPVTFKNAKKPKEVAARVPLDKLLIETDSPYLTPHPFRGNFPNEPACVRLVAEEIARIKAVDYVNVATYTSANAEKLFNI